MFLLPEISRLNLATNFSFKILKIDNIIQDTDKLNNKRYLIDFFIWEVKDFYSCRVILDIILYNDGTKYLNQIALSNADLENQPFIKNNIYGVDTNMVIRKNNLRSSENQLVGIDNSVLTMTPILKQEDSKRTCNFSRIRNRWILPKNMPDSCTFPCNKQANCWDQWGVLYNCGKNTNNCIGINTSATPKSFQPYINPTIIGVPANENKYLDLMKLTRGWIKPLWTG